MECAHATALTMLHQPPSTHYRPIGVEEGCKVATATAHATAAAKLLQNYGHGIANAIVTGHAHRGCSSHFLSWDNLPLELTLEVTLQLTLTLALPGGYIC